jgi:phage-related protein
MSYENFPELSKKPDQEQYGEELEDVTDTATTEGGYEFTRPKHARKPRMKWATGYTEVPDADKVKLMDFLTKKGRHTAFYWEHPIYKTQHLVRFAKVFKPDYANFLANDHHWNVHGIELREV